MKTVKAIVTASALLLATPALHAETRAESAPQASEAPAPKAQTRFQLHQQAEPLGSGRMARAMSNGIGVYEAEINLYEDFDRDGHYSSFSVSYDADDLSGYGLYAYTVVSLVNEYGGLETLFTSPVFYIYGDTASDAQRHSITLLNDYDSAHYRLRIDLYSSNSGQLLDTLVTSSVEPIPLEGQYYDSTPPDTVVVEEHYYDDGYADDHGGGGSWTLAGLAALGLLAARRRFVLG